MGMSTSVVGFRPPDEQWKKMKKAWDACQEAGIDPPREVDQFFGGEPPDDAGVEVSRTELEKMGAVKQYSDDSVSGYEIDVTKLPKDLKIIRVYNSW